MTAASAADSHDIPSGGMSPPPSGERRPGLTPFSLFLVLIILYLLVKVQLVLMLTLMALLFATVIERPVNLLERRRIPRGLSILTVYIAIIGGLVLLSLIVAPGISNEADNFRQQAPDQLRELQQSWRVSRNPLLSGAGQDLLGRAARAIQAPPTPEQQTAITVLIGLVGGVVGLLTTLIIAFYYLLEKDLLRGLILSQLQPTTRTRVTRVWDNVEAQVGRWLRGQLTLCLIIGTIATIGYGIIDVRFWPLLGLWSGLTEIIPIVGPWLGGIPAVIIAMTQSWQKAFIVAIFIVGIQTMENAVLVPRVMRGAVGLTPLTVFVAILAGTEFKGIAGALLAIPVAAAVQVIITDYLRTRREAAQLAEPSLHGWRWMRGHVSPGAVDTDHPGAAVPPDEPRPPARSSPGSTPPAAADQGWTSQLLARVSRAVSADDDDTPPPAAPASGSRPAVTKARD